MALGFEALHPGIEDLLQFDEASLEKLRAFLNRAPQAGDQRSLSDLPRALLQVLFQKRRLLGSRQ